MIILPCGKKSHDCDGCTEVECIADDLSFYDEKAKCDAMDKVVSIHDIRDIEGTLLVSEDHEDQYEWPWPISPNGLKKHLEELITSVCTEKQANIVRLRHRWDSNRASGLSFTKIGTLLGITKQTVREQYRAALLHIERALSKDPLWRQDNA
jgi:hypothetical protein